MCSVWENFFDLMSSFQSHPRERICVAGWWVYWLVGVTGDGVRGGGGAHWALGPREVILKYQI